MGRFHQRSRLMLVALDDEVGAVSGSKDVRRSLGELLERADFLRLLICSREPIYDHLGSMQMRNFLLEGLPSIDAARLFLLRIHRRLSPVDLTPPGSRYSTLPAANDNDELEKTCIHVCQQAWFQRLHGNPGQICALSSRVVPNGESLYKLDMER